VVRESGGDFAGDRWHPGSMPTGSWCVWPVNRARRSLSHDAMVEGAKRQKTPNEIALTILSLL